MHIVSNRSSSLSILLVDFSKDFLYSEQMDRSIP